MNKNNTKKLPQYKGKLSASQIAQGMNAAKSNAKRLLKSAKIIFENGDYATATSLAILSIEESGKSSILRRLSLENDNIALNNCWKDYRTHIKKTIIWDMCRYIKGEKCKIEDFKEMFSDNNISPFHLEQIKQIGFYTDCLGNAHWSIPNEIIEKEFAQDMLMIAGVHCQNDEVVTQREIELWIECMKPVWRKSINEMKQGLILWRRRMKDEKLIPDSDKFDKFIMSGIHIPIQKKHC